MSTTPPFRKLPVPGTTAQPGETASSLPAARGVSGAADCGLPAECAEQAVQISRANAGDHVLIHQLLLAVHQSPSREEFQASLDDPYYETGDRLLVRHARRIVSHVHLTKRVMRFGEIQFPIAEVQWLATLPEYRGAGYARRLMEAADAQMPTEGAVVGMLRTDKPRLFKPLGWVECGRPRCLRIDARHLRASLDERLGLSRRRRGQLSTRMWRHVELPSLMRLYEQGNQQAYGPLARSEPYWRWLISRQGYGQIIVAIRGDDTLEFGEQAPDIVGYVVTRNDQIVELYALGDHPTIVGQLLSRACREAIERDHHSLLIFAPPTGNMTAAIEEAGATVSDKPGPIGDMVMAKILDPQEFVHRLYPELYRRAKCMDLARPFEFSVRVDDQAMRFSLTRRSSKLAPIDQTEVDLQVDCAAWSQLLLGLLDLSDPQTLGVEIKTPSLAQTLIGLFPQLAFCRPPFDSLQA